MHDGARPDYTLLAAYLAASLEPRVTLTCEQLEAIIGGPLPLGARLGRSWWVGPARRRHGEPWTRSGWRVERVDAYAGTVTFAESGAAPQA